MNRVLVFGLGRFGGGVAAARHFAALGAEVVATDSADEKKLASSIAEVAPLGVRLHLGPPREEDFRACDTLVVNPAIPFDHPMVDLARRSGAEIVTELGLTLRRLRGPVVGVTGTNGKSTTSTLIAAMLKRSGRSVALGGNIGHSLLNEAQAHEPGTVAVLEISSFQLHWLESGLLRPLAAVVTNVTGDHLDRHKTFGHYAASKRRLVDSVPGGGTVVLCADDPTCRAYGQGARGQVEWFGRDLAPPVPLTSLRLRGAHNLLNAAAACRAALAAGATQEGCEAAMASFATLPYRLEPLGEVGGVLRINDSVSTSPEAVAAAIASFDRPVVLLTGGRDKGLPLGPLVESARRARAVVAYGEMGPRLAREIPGSALEPGFDAAVRRGIAVSRPGDVLLLSPGFSSYDEFPSFDVRGDRFRELVGETAR